jgi:glycosyltransferase involved in cell wall biosynthesis
VRILVATDQWSPDVVGGSARVAADTARALARRGHELTVLAPTRRDLPVESTEQGVEVRRALGRLGLPQSVADPFAAWRAARRTRRQPFDLLLAHQATNAVGLGHARGNVPLAVVFHASAVLELRFLREREQGARRLAGAALDPLVSVLERRSLARADGILVLSEFSEGIVGGRHPGARDRIHRVTGGVDDAFFAPPDETGAGLRRRYAIPEDALLLFSARRLEPRMGLEELVRAVSLLHDRGAVLVLTGEGGLRDRLASLARELGIGERIRLVGRVSEIELRSFYAAADLFVLPTVAYEGFGLSTVEALAQGTPVLGTAVGATPEILRPLGEEFVVAEARPEALAAAIGAVVSLLGPDLSSRCITVARAYHWDAAIVAWEDALAAVAS